MIILTPKTPPYYSIEAGETNTLILTDTQIKALPTTPIELLPALNDKWYNILQAILKIETPVAYTNVNATTAVQLYIGNTINVSSILNAVDMLTIATPDPQYAIMNPVGIVSDISGFEAYLEAPIMYGPDLIDQPLNLLVQGNTGNFTGGGVNNRITIKLYYNIQTL